ncbi:MAG: alpha/beta fold hydrolase [Rubritalea sp.]|uniref:alpha/beta fold hydrolase n=1 Tax=Rubritalea sp. TaxID=2109375 RepID=UPI003242DD3D
MPEFTSFDTTAFNYQQWGDEQSPSAIVIGIHGFCGAACDFTGLANFLCQQNPQLGFVAYNLRGMGLDPVKNRRGDIESPDYWARDLLHFCAHIRTLYPAVPLVWCAESLGALISCNTLSTIPSARDFCDALILYSPVVAIDQQVAAWKISLARTLARLFPEKRIQLSLFTGSQSVQVTQGATDHTAQSSTNAWHVSSFSMRLLNAIAGLIEGMPQAAASLTCPTLVINGGHDFFTPPSLLEHWLTHLPASSAVEHSHFPDSYHLMLYDSHADAIFSRTAHWLSQRI